MGQIVIVEGLRTAVGRFGGTIKDFRAQDLGGFVIKAVMEKTGLDPELIDEVVMGNCHYNGYPGVARLSLFRSGLPPTPSRPRRWNVNAPQGFWRWPRPETLLRPETAKSSWPAAQRP